MKATKFFYGLYEFPSVQCASCLRLCESLVEGEINDYKIFVVEDHKESCQFYTRKGQRHLVDVPE